MKNSFEHSADYIVSSEILQQVGEFTIDKILKELEEVLLVFFKTAENILSFIIEKISSLCKVGLVSYTGFVYYVNN